MKSVIIIGFVAVVLGLGVVVARSDPEMGGSDCTQNQDCNNCITAYKPSPVHPTLFTSCVTYGGGDASGEPLQVCVASTSSSEECGQEYTDPTVTCENTNEWHCHDVSTNPALAVPCDFTECGCSGDPDDTDDYGVNITCTMPE